MSDTAIPTPDRTTVPDNDMSHRLDSRFVEMWRLAKAFPGPKGPVEVVSEFSILVPRGEFVCIIGHSGCGKSTVLSMVAGLTDITRGAVVIDNQEINGPGPDRGMVFQSPCLLPWMSALENVRLGVGQVRPNDSRAEQEAFAKKYLELVGLGDALHKRPAELSQGMRQRVGIARAFALSPKVLLLDEPFGMLDCITRMELQDALLQLWTRERQTALMVTHDVDEAIMLADRVVMMTNGPNARVGEIVEIPFARPRIRETLMETPEYYAVRERLIGFLEAQSHHEGNGTSNSQSNGKGSDQASEIKQTEPTPAPERSQAAAMVDAAAAIKRNWSLRAFGHASLATLLLCAAIVIGSGGMKHFDPALTHYASGAIVALFAVVYRLSMWLSRPPTRILIRRAFINVMEARAASRMLKLEQAAQAPRKSALALLKAFTRRLIGAFLVQDFIRKRGWLRWGAHAGLSYGSMIAFAMTFPLVFGWVHFETPGDARMYHVHVLGLEVDKFHVDSVKAFAAFNLLNLSAVMVLIGAALASWRRLRDRGERAVQTFREDWMPIILLVAVSATGLLMTASARLAEGEGYVLAATAHAAAVIALLLFIPFGKLFHMFQRTAALAVVINKKAAATGAAARCRTCDAEFASAAQVEDLQVILAQVHLLPTFQTPEGPVPYTQICPSCRRRLLAVNQGRALAR